MSHPGKLFRYSASAGSGKTHALTGFYLSRILHDPSAYRRILAVTFTNSAASEMKGRILSRLDKLSGEPADEKEKKEAEDFAMDLCARFPELFPDRSRVMTTIRHNAPIALQNILQDYSRFSVGTIDSFFQRIIRAFAREIDIPSGYEIELEHDILLGNAVDELFAGISEDPRLRSWISGYISSRLDDNKNWDIRREIMEVSERIFGEDFRQLSDDDRKQISDYELMQNYTGKVFRIKSSFESRLRELAEQGSKIIAECGLEPGDFFYRERGGVGAWFRKYAAGKTDKVNSYWRKAVNENTYLARDAGPEKMSALGAALKRGLGDIAGRIMSMFDNEHRLYVTALVQVKTIHVIGILGAIAAKVRQLAHDKNLFLLSDSGELINRLIADDDTPFIYERTGTQYDHFIIDEFQDTSRIQWRNFMPLINETLSRGKDNLVVGDVKQSIYRWRNSDWRILHSEIAGDFGAERVKTIPLEVNYRSRQTIIDFNNFLFRPEGIPALCDEKLQNPHIKFTSVYAGAVQQGTEERKGGMVRVTLYSRDTEEKWKTNVLADLPGVIESLQDKGYRARDILILCRTNVEGKSVISRILEYTSECDPGKLERYNYEVTSADSLFLERSPAVTFLLSCMRYMTDPHNRINVSEMVRSYVLIKSPESSNLYTGDTGIDIPEELFPDGWQNELEKERNSPLFTLSEKMTGIFGLGNSPENVAFLNSFQDIVLSYSSRHSSDMTSFLAWWESEGYRKTVAQSDRQDAVRVMTIHKAKGLQSRAVIIPFASWEFSVTGHNRPLLWVTDVPPEFSPMPVVLPEFSAQLSESLFADDAARETAAAWLDGLNMLYVALTRAVDTLMIMAPDDKKPEEVKAGADSLLRKTLSEGFGESVWQQAEGKRYLEIGEIPGVTADTDNPVLSLKDYRVSPRTGRLHLRTGGVIPADDIKLEEASPRHYGIMMHEILSNIITVNDIDQAVMKACEKGLLQKSDYEETSARIRKMLSDERVKRWFDSSSRLMNEAAIILPSGRIRRPDRVMIGSDRVTIVDFKFGEPETHHISQAKSYIEVIEKMGYNDVKAFLWYVSKDIITEV